MIPREQLAVLLITFSSGILTLHLTDVLSEVTEMWDIFRKDLSRDQNMLN